MKKTFIIATFILFFPAFVSGFTKAELEQQLSTLEGRVGALSVYITRAESGTPLPKSKADMLADISIIRGEGIRIQKDLIALTPVACTYTYSQYGECQANSTKTRTVTASAPSGCTGTPVLSQPCTYVPPSCTYTYADWNDCQTNNTQTRSVLSSLPAGCRGTPVLSQSCTYGASAGGDSTIARADTGGSSVTTITTTNVGPAAGADPGPNPNPNPGTLIDPNNPANSQFGNGEGGLGNGGGDAQNLEFGGFLDRLSGVFDSIIPFIIGLAVFFIIWQIFTYITHAADEEKRSEAKRFIVYGVIGVFLMLSIWGFVNIIANTLNIGRTISPDDIPKVPTILPIPRR